MMKASGSQSKMVSINKSKLRAHALLLGDRLDLKPLKTTEQLAAIPLSVPVSEQGIAVLFRYGVVVLFAVTPIEEATFLNHLQAFVSEPFTEPESETLEMRIDPMVKEGFEKDRLFVSDASLQRLQIVADILAKSLVLAEYEKRIADTFDRIEPLAMALERSGSSTYPARELLRHIGSTLLSLHRMVGRVEVGEKPEILWERPELELLYVHLEAEYELKERQLALERKLQVISRTAETLLDLLHAKRSLRVEWYIVILIVVEIVLTLYELFFRLH
jgi:uncharacterized Rmd1/YagE family protein